MSTSDERLWYEVFRRRGEVVKLFGASRECPADEGTRGEFVRGTKADVTAWAWGGEYHDVEYRRRD